MGTFGYIGSIFWYSWGDIDGLGFVLSWSQDTQESSALPPPSVEYMRGGGRVLADIQLGLIGHVLAFGTWLVHAHEL